MPTLNSMRISLLNALLILLVGCNGRGCSSSEQISSDSKTVTSEGQEYGIIAKVREYTRTKDFRSSSSNYVDYFVTKRGLKCEGTGGGDRITNSWFSKNHLKGASVESAHNGFVFRLVVNNEVKGCWFDLDSVIVSSPIKSDISTPIIQELSPPDFVNYLISDYGEYKDNLLYKAEEHKKISYQNALKYSNVSDSLYFKFLNNRDIVEERSGIFDTRSVVEEVENRPGLKPYFEEKLNQLIDAKKDNHASVRGYANSLFAINSSLERISFYDSVVLQYNPFLDQRHGMRDYISYRLKTGIPLPKKWDDYLRQQSKVYIEEKKQNDRVDQEWIEEVYRHYYGKISP